jgi:hypothetical protein
MFVAASIGAGIFTADRRVGMQSFLSPTVVHFTIILVTCLMAGAPDQTWKSFGALIVIMGIRGTAYSAGSGAGWPGVVSVLRLLSLIVYGTPASQF